MAPNYEEDDVEDTEDEEEDVEEEEPTTVRKRASKKAWKVRSPRRILTLSNLTFIPSSCSAGSQQAEARDERVLPVQPG